MALTVEKNQITGIFKGQSAPFDLGYEAYELGNNFVGISAHQEYLRLHAFYDPGTSDYSMFKKAMMAYVMVGSLNLNGFPILPDMLDIEMPDVVHPNHGFLLDMGLLMPSKKRRLTGQYSESVQQMIATLRVEGYEQKFTFLPFVPQMARKGNPKLGIKQLLQFDPLSFGSFSLPNKKFSELNINAALVPSALIDIRLDHLPRKLRTDPVITIRDTMLYEQMAQDSGKIENLGALLLLLVELAEENSMRIQRLIRCFTFELVQINAIGQSVKYALVLTGNHSDAMLTHYVYSIFWDDTKKAVRCSTLWLPLHSTHEDILQAVRNDSGVFASTLDLTFDDLNSALSGAYNCYETFAYGATLKMKYVSVDTLLLERFADDEMLSAKLLKYNVDTDIASPFDFDLDLYDDWLLEHEERGEEADADWLRIYYDRTLQQEARLMEEQNALLEDFLEQAGRNFTYLPQDIDQELSIEYEYFFVPCLTDEKGERIKMPLIARMFKLGCRRLYDPMNDLPGLDPWQKIEYFITDETSISEHLAVLEKLEQYKTRLVG